MSRKDIIMSTTIEKAIRTEMYKGSYVIHCTSEKIESMEFANDPYVQCVVIDEGITEIRSWPFYDCKHLKRIVLPSTLTKIGFAAFHGCKSLESIVIPNGVTEIGGSAFFGCESLESIKLPSTLEFIGIKAYEGTNLHSYVGNFTAIEVAFDGFVREATVRGDIINFAHKKWVEKCDGQLNLCGYHVYHNLFTLFNYFGGSLFDGKLKVYECKTKKMIDTNGEMSVVETFKTTKLLSVEDIINILNNN